MEALPSPSVNAASLRGPGGGVCGAVGFAGGAQAAGPPVRAALSGSEAAGLCCQRPPEGTIPRRSPLQRRERLPGESLPLRAELGRHRRAPAAARVPSPELHAAPPGCQQGFLQSLCFSHPRVGFFLSRGRPEHRERRSSLCPELHRHSSPLAPGHRGEDHHTDPPRTHTHFSLVCF